MRFNTKTKKAPKKHWFDTVYEDSDGEIRINYRKQIFITKVIFGLTLVLCLGSIAVTIGTEMSMIGSAIANGFFTVINYYSYKRAKYNAMKACAEKI